jgi:hypothetical protein
MKKLLGSTLVCLTLLTSAVYASTTLTFDDLNNIDLPRVTDGYGGFTWNNATPLAVQDKNNVLILGTGYDYGAVSGNNTVFNEYGNTPVDIRSVGGSAFTFNDAYFTSAWFDQQVSFQGLHNGNVLYTSAWFNINTTTPLDIVLNWSGINEFIIVNNGSQYAMDNFTTSAPSAVPVPAAIWLFASGLLGLGALRKKTQA